MTLPIQFVRFVIPFRKFIGSQRHIIETTSRHRADTVRNPAAQQISRMAGLPNAKFKMAPIIASPAATGRMRLAVYVHMPASTSAIANFVPEFHPCSKACVLAMDKRNIPPRIE